MKLSIKDFSSKQETADLVTFTEEILNGKLHFLCSVRCRIKARTLSKLVFGKSIKSLKFGFKFK